MNGKRVFIGMIVGGVAWTIWSMTVNMGFLKSVYMAEQASGHLLTQPRYGLSAFMITWIVVLFLLSGVAALLYAAVRKNWGVGPKSALKLGVLLGFVAGFPVNFSITSWVPVTRTVALWWSLDMWVGMIIATLVAGWLYKD
ncbi:MAG: hypothetical protein KGL13_05770 [Gammaproteobacteria bacterium]|nr:hypothetical protein [Gammaproteobacteria bacterium]MDE2345958.1 hypothetical protein [Gammaproteobacteria bacterium]